MGVAISGPWVSENARFILTNILILPVNCDYLYAALARLCTLNADLRWVNFMEVIGEFFLFKLMCYLATGYSYLMID